MTRPNQVAGIEVEVKSDEVAPATDATQMESEVLKGDQFSGTPKYGWKGTVTSHSSRPKYA